MVDFKKYIRDVPDFPKPGILFRDISPLLYDAKVFDSALTHLASQLPVNECDAFIGIESRGFILAAALAQKFHKGFVPCRKAGKLPPPTHAKSYKLEYGEATLELAQGSGKVIVVDDVLATGGTLEAALHLSKSAGYNALAATVLIDLVFLNSFRFLGKPIPSLVQYH